ncbi:MAG: gamma-glutamyltranspeptidase / glutathione hydrolase [Alphaproteobacteria bacterium]|nr:gamma-glutamyltranspeptidase / glutathione hydrolase [Alphaproteobacteria bacterium]
MAWLRTTAEQLTALAGRIAKAFTPPSFAQAGESPTQRRGGHVVCYHPQARDIGEAILAAGGNAFDAFVATTAAENVLSEGATSLAGSLGVVIYRARDGLISYLDATHDDPLDSAALWTAQDPAAGKAALVPGAPAGLAALARSHGRLSLEAALAPAIALAEEGFPVCRLMAATIAHRARILRRTDYGRQTYLPDGKPMRPGDTLRLPRMAAWLRGFAERGSSYVYHGGFGRQFIATVRAEGGRLTERDLAAYRERWCVPWTTTFRDVTLHSCSGRSYGGLWTLLALKTLEHAAASERPHYAEDARALERMIRIAREVWSEQFLFEDVVEKDPAAVQSRLTSEYTATIWDRVIKQSPALASPPGGTHSFHIITTDADGNIASGTTTAQSEPWGDGIFVEGLPLTTAGRLPFSAGLARRRLSPLSIHLALRGGRPLFSLGAISNSVAEAAFQIIVNLIDHRLPVREALEAPRFGTFPPDARQMPRLDRNWLDPRIDRKIVRALRRRGLKVQRRGMVDTGLGAVQRFHDGETSEGGLVPIPYLAQPFCTPADRSRRESG